MGLVGLLEDFFGLTGQGRVVHLKLVALVQDHISRDTVTALKLNDVTGHKVDCFSGLPDAVTADLTFLGDEVFEVIHEGGSLGGLRVGEDASDEHDDSEDDAQVEVRLVSLVLLDTVGDETEDGTEPEEEGEEAGLLLQEEDPAWGLASLSQLVETLLAEDVVSLDRAQTTFAGLGVILLGLEFLLEVLDRPHVLFLLTGKGARVSN